MAEPPENPKKADTMALAVIILTADHEISGTIHVPRTAREDRRLTALLNDGTRRFLAVTDARLVSRQGPATPRLYRFLQLHMDRIVMIHPATQAVSGATGKDEIEARRWVRLRERVNRK